MKMTRREFITGASVALGAASIPLPAGGAPAEETPAKQQKFSRPSRMHLGLVTYNLAADWDIPTIIKNCEAAKFEGVELRTSHAHKVELNLSKQERSEVKKRFQDSRVQLFGLGSTYDYHTPDQAKLRKDIEETKQYVLLAEDVGATGVKVRPNGLPKEVPVDKTLAQIGKALKEIGEFARDHGQMIRLEMHGSETSFPPNIKTILDVADHPNVGACWNSNKTDLDGEGWDHNFDLVKNKIVSVHITEIFAEDYPYRKLFTRLNENNYAGFCLAEIPATTDPVRLMKYYRGLWLAYQGLL